MKAEDYEVVKVIGRGAFGEVQLVRMSSFVFLNNKIIKNAKVYAFLLSASLMFFPKSAEVLYECYLIVTFSSFLGKTQSHKQGIRHEAAEQV